MSDTSAQPSWQFHRRGRCNRYSRRTVRPSARRIHRSACTTGVPGVSGSMNLSWRLSRSRTRIQGHTRAATRTGRVPAVRAGDDLEGVLHDCRPLAPRGARPRRLKELNRQRRRHDGGTGRSPDHEPSNHGTLARLQPADRLVQQGDHAHRVGDLAAPEHAPRPRPTSTRRTWSRSVPSGSLGAWVSSVARKM